MRLVVLRESTSKEVAGEVDGAVQLVIIEGRDSWAQWMAYPKFAAQEWA